MAKIIGIGNALVDVIVNLPEESILQDFSLPKGGMEMIDVEKKRQIHERISKMKQVRATGGSTSNTIHGIARLGGDAGYIGKVGNDEMGRFFEEDMKKSGITPHLIHTNDIDTGIATTLMTEDAERTFATYLGAAAAMTADEIDSNILKGYDCIHVEGYLIFNHNLILRACQVAKEHGLKISMDMASYNLVEAEKEFVGVLLRNYVDIIFANEEEAHAFTGKNGEEALAELSRYCEVAVVKLGGKGLHRQCERCACGRRHQRQKACGHQRGGRCLRRRFPLRPDAGTFARENHPFSRYGWRRSRGYYRC